MGRSLVIRSLVHGLLVGAVVISKVEAKLEVDWSQQGKKKIIVQTRGFYTILHLSQRARHTLGRSDIRLRIRSASVHMVRRGSDGVRTVTGTLYDRA